MSANVTMALFLNAFSIGSATVSSGWLVSIDLNETDSPLYSVVKNGRV